MSVSVSLSSFECVCVRVCVCERERERKLVVNLRVPLKADRFMAEAVDYFRPRKENNAHPLSSLPFFCSSKFLVTGFPPGTHNFNCSV